MGRLVLIQKPPRDKLLAELTGILLGDGGITHYQVAITLNSLDEIDYGKFIILVIKNLFNIVPAIYPNQKYNAYNIVISSRAAVQFLTEEVGLVVGNKIKQSIDIPRWIVGKKELSIACLRGLVDTDGSVFFHKYRVGGKLYLYKKLDFTSLSYPLCVSTINLFKAVGIKVRFCRNKSVRIDDQNEMKKYFSIVGTHNPKHLKRYLS